MNTKNEKAWFEDYGNIVELARWLADRGDLESEEGPLGQILYFLEKPWKWTEEYEEMLRAKGRAA